MKSNKGISMVSIVITIVVIIIIAAVSINVGLESIANAEKASFQNDFQNAVMLFNTYNTEAVLRGDKSYNRYKFCWDGVSEHAEGTAKMENGVDEDTISYVFKNRFPNSLKGKIEIYEGDFYIYEEYAKEAEWLTELYRTEYDATVIYEDEHNNGGNETVSSLPGQISFNLSQKPITTGKEPGITGVIRISDDLIISGKISFIGGKNIGDGRVAVDGRIKIITDESTFKPQANQEKEQVKETIAEKQTEEKDAIPAEAMEKDELSEKIIENVEEKISDKVPEKVLENAQESILEQAMESKKEVAPEMMEVAEQEMNEEEAVKEAISDYEMKAVAYEAEAMEATEMYETKK